MWSSSFVISSDSIDMSLMLSSLSLGDKHSFAVLVLPAVSVFYHYGPCPFQCINALMPDQDQDQEVFPFEGVVDVCNEGLHHWRP